MAKKKEVLPTTITVLGHDFSVKWNHEFENDESFGDTCYEDRAIRIGTKCDTAEKRAATLLHEICHAAIGVTGLEHMLGDKLEEAVVSGLENALYPLLETINTVRRIDR